MTTGSRKNQTEFEVKPNGFTDERILERSPEDTRRSPVQIRAAPPQFLSWFLRLFWVGKQSLPPPPRFFSWAGLFGGFVAGLLLRLFVDFLC